MLKFNGKITSGLNRASEFMKKEIYASQYQEKLGYTPYYGTLNITLEDDVHLDVNGKLKKDLKIIHGNSEYGDVFFLNAKITNPENNISKTGDILFPTKTVYTFNTLEFIADEKLRERLLVDDEDCVIIELLL
ncbi:MAG: CTP-dependent riboflavin kinase [Methanosphaera sp.]|nr:CTP-dependent riboflavin kinase [Methanosphaera sp.]